MLVCCISLHNIDVYASGFHFLLLLCCLVERYSVGLLVDVDVLCSRCVWLNNIYVFSLVHKNICLAFHHPRLSVPGSLQ